MDNLRLLVRGLVREAMNMKLSGVDTDDPKAGDAEYTRLMKLASDLIDHLSSTHTVTGVRPASMGPHVTREVLRGVKVYVRECDMGWADVAWRVTLMCDSDPLQAVREFFSAEEEKGAGTPICSGMNSCSFFARGMECEVVPDEHTITLEMVFKEVL